MSNIVAVLTSDWHLSLTPPVARSAEPDWLKAQQRPLDEIAGLQKKYQCPVIIAGDLFDKWNASAELLNWTIDHLPNRCYAIPGQHDLPQHRYEDIEKSGYWNLVKAGAITNLNPVESTYINKRTVIAYGFPWGYTTVPNEGASDWAGPNAIHIAVIHAYCWKKGYSYNDAPKEGGFANWYTKLKGYTVGLFGDNHIPFKIDAAGNAPTIINTGTLMRRKLDERRYEPSVGLLHFDGTVTTHKLDCSKDKFIDVEPLRPVFESGAGAEDFLEGLRGLSVENITYRDAVRRWLDHHKVGADAKRLIEEVLG